MEHKAQYSNKAQYSKNIEQREDTKKIINFEGKKLERVKPTDFQIFQNYSGYSGTFSNYKLKTKQKRAPSYFEKNVG